VRAAVAQLSEISRRFEAFVARQDSELAALQSRVAARERELTILAEDRARERARRNDTAWQERQAALERQCEEARAALTQAQAEAGRLPGAVAELEAAHAELAQLRQELAASHDASAAARIEAEQACQSRESDHARRIEDLRRERDQLRGDLAALRESASRHEGESAELAAARRELAALGQEVARARDAAAHGEARIAAAREESAQVWQARFEEGERERAEMAAELELLLARAADLAETTARERRESAQERTTWEAEVSALRRALAVPAAPAREGTVRPLAGHGGESLPRPARTNRSSRPAGDPVLESVVAQFANLKQAEAGSGPAGRKPR
jgi:chromosome segregation ATPase